MRSSSAASKPSADTPEPRAEGLFELGAFPAFARVQLSCTACPNGKENANTAGGGLTAGYRRGDLLLAAYGEFERSFGGFPTTHTALGAWLQFGFESLPVAAQLRVFRDSWRFPYPSETSSVKSGVGIGAGVVVDLRRALDRDPYRRRNANAKNSNTSDHRDNAIGFEAFVSADIADLGRFTDQAGTTDADAYALRLLLGVRLSVDTLLGCTDCQN